MIEKQLRRIGKKISKQAFIQRIMNIGVEIKRFPKLIYRLYVFASKDSAETRRTVSAMQVFMAEQLPALLQTISEINNKNQNIDRSLPVALRSNARELADIRKQLDTAMKSIDSLSQSLEPQKKGSRYNAEQVLGRGRLAIHESDKVTTINS